MRQNSNQQSNFFTSFCQQDKNHYKLNNTNKMMFSLISLKNIFFFFILIVISMFALPVHSQYTKNCHYSCKYCGSPYYSHCIICEDPFTLSPIKNAENIKQYYNTLEEQPWGPCIGTLPGTNALGIVLVVITIISLIYFKNRTIFYIISSLQTLALFSFIETGYTYPISYVLQSLEYFMLITSLNRPNRQVKLQIFDDQRYRMWEFLNSYQFDANFTPIFILSILCFAVALLIPVARYFSKQESSLWSICNCIKLQKIFNYLEISSLITFFFLIQQSILIISIGLFLDDNFVKDSGNIVMVVIYFIMLAFMVVDLCMKNLEVFSNKIGEQIQILKKTVAPVFIILPINAIIAVTAFDFVLSFISIIFAKLSSKTKKRTYFHEKLLNREVKYRIVELIIIILIIVYYLVEKNVQTYKASLATGIIAVITISIFLLCFFVQVAIQLFGKFCLKQTQLLYENGGFQLSSLRQSKMLEETVQNFQTTDEGVMDMIFFGRNNQQQNSENNKQQKKPKKTNIHLTLDQLNEQILNNQQDEKFQGFTPSVSPKHRQLERMLRSKTSRTPKNDRTSRFKLNKAFDTERSEQNGIEKIQAAKISTKEEQIFESSNDASEMNYNRQQTAQISELSSNNLPNTTQRQVQQPIKIVPQVNDQLPFEQQKSPRFNQFSNQQQYDPVAKMTQKPPTKNHILNIFNSEDQNQDDLENQNEKNIFDPQDFKAVRKQSGKTIKK